MQSKSEITEWAKQFCYDLTGMAPELSVAELVHIKEQKYFWADYSHFLIDSRHSAKKYVQYILDNEEVPDPMKTSLEYLIEKILGESYDKQ